MFLFGSNATNTSTKLPILDSDRIELNVGGERFPTTKTTVSRCGGPLAQLAAFAEKSRSNDTSVPVFFVDRDPKHFRKVLNFLRTDRLVLDTSITTQELHELKIEALYYEIKELIDGVQSVIDKRLRTNTLSSPSARAIIRVYYPDPSKEKLLISPFPLPDFLSENLKLEKLTKAYAEGIEAVVNIMLEAGMKIEKSHWDSENRLKSFVVLSI